MVMVLLLFFQIKVSAQLAHAQCKWHTDNQIFLDRRVTKFSKVWGSAPTQELWLIDKSVKGYFRQLEQQKRTLPNLIYPTAILVSNLT